MPAVHPFGSPWSSGFAGISTTPIVMSCGKPGASLGSGSPSRPGGRGGVTDVPCIIGPAIATMLLTM